MPALGTAPGREVVRRRAVVPVLAMGAGALLATIYVASVSPYEGGHYPTCPTLALTGWYCAGCGALRAVHDLTHLDLAGAWGMNPFVVLALPVLVVTWVLWLRRAWTGEPRRWIAPAWAVWVLLGVVVGYSVARNVPALAPWLAP